MPSNYSKSRGGCISDGYESKELDAPTDWLTDAHLGCWLQDSGCFGGTGSGPSFSYDWARLACNQYSAAWEDANYWHLSKNTYSSGGSPWKCELYKGASGFKAASATDAAGCRGLCDDAWADAQPAVTTCIKEDTTANPPTAPIAACTGGVSGYKIKNGTIVADQYVELGGIEPGDPVTFQWLLNQAGVLCCVLSTGVIDATTWQVTADTSNYPNDYRCDFFEGTNLVEKDSNYNCGKVGYNGPPT